MGRILCWLGFHHWRIDDGMYCDRGDGCRYAGMRWYG